MIIEEGVAHQLLESKKSDYRNGFSKVKEEHFLLQLCSLYYLKYVTCQGLVVVH